LTTFLGEKTGTVPGSKNQLGSDYFMMMAPPALHPPKKITMEQKSKRKAWPYCGHRVKRWKEKNGVGVFTLISANTAAAIKKESLRHKKPQWKILRSCIEYGFHVAVRRGF